MKVLGRLNRDSNDADWNQLFSLGLKPGTMALLGVRIRLSIYLREARSVDKCERI